MTWSVERIAVVGLLLFLQSCGGGGDSSADAPAIFVNVGPDLNVTEQSEVMLTAQTQSSDSSLSFAWTANPSLTITHDDTTTADASFVAPTVTDDVQYTFTLNVTGSMGGGGQDSLLVTVLADNIPPVAVISTPVFDNAEEGFLPAGETVVLDGSQSADADAPVSERPIMQWLWQQTSGVDVLGNTAVDLPQLEFTAPIPAQRESITLSLTVTDAEGATHTTEYSPTILSSSETPPNVDAGFDQFRFSGEVIVLNGQASSTVPAALPLVVEWENNSQVTIDSPSVADTFALAPDVPSVMDVEFRFRVTDQFGNQVSDTLAAQVRPVPIPVLNDTGVMLQGTVNSVVNTQQNDFPGQDAQFGIDRFAASMTIEKAGQGRGGFDFTPLNSNGDEMDDLSMPWQCVRDNTTGLVWEVKTDDATLYDTDNTYSWLQNEDNGGFEGDMNGANTSCTLTNCNTQDYVSAVNAAGLCGFFDWRLPNHDELMSIVDFGASTGLKIDTQYFSNTGANSVPALWYWTNQPGADGVSADGAQNAWAIDFVSGVDNFLNKSTAAQVRLVRAGR